MTNFKTIKDCAVILVAHTTMPLEYSDNTGSAILHEDMNLFPATAARVSFGNDLKLHDEAKDRKLIKYLADHEHTSTFEHQSATFMLEVPLFIRSQIHRHRTFSYNEISRRYTSENLEFWKPDAWHKQAESNKQASDGDFLAPLLDDDYVLFHEQALEAYEVLLKHGVAREQARAVLPQSLLTRFYMTGNLRNWAHFVKLRTDEHSQKEVQVVANKISDKLDDLWPTSWRALTRG